MSQQYKSEKDKGKRKRRNAAKSLLAAFLNVTELLEAEG
jgi:hypothetical protein